MNTVLAKRILLLGAHRDALGHYRRFLEATGYTIEIATLDEETVEDIERWAPAMIILDFLADSIQEAQGWQLMQHLAALAATASIPIFICSTGLLLHDYQVYVEQYHVPVLFKPFLLEELGRMVRHLLPEAI